MRAGIMGGARTAMCAALAGAALAASSGAARAEVLVSGDPALYWNQVLAQGLTGSPTVTSRSYAMVSTAIHESVNATTGFQDNSYIKGVQTSGGDTRVATAVAAHTLLVTLNPSKTADYNAALAASLALVPDGAAKTNGIATGTAIAAATLALRANDGSFTPSTYVPSGTLGNWAPTPPAYAAAAVPQWADSTPWVMTSGSQFRPDAPPDIGSIAYAVAYNEILAVGGATSAIRTADQSAAAKFWEAASGTAPWIKAGLGVAETSNLSTLENARLFAVLSVAVADSVIAIWDAKYEYDYWRPVTAIHAGAFDGNAGTTADLAWLPFLTTPPHPSYISGHSGVGSAAATVLAAFLGDSHNFCLTANALTRCWGSFNEAALDGANSRLWGGIHWRFDNENGFAVGQNVANYTLASSAFDAVPEPATWAMMIVGFGFAGALIRRRSRVAHPAAG
jgi:PAP2 superfamily protein/PEP-CTERM motif-containing protein